MELQFIFLQLLEISAKSISVKQHLERKLIFGVIVSLLLREEFRFYSLVQRTQQGHIEVLAGYNHQLHKCVLATIECLQDINEYSDAATINSCMKILAIAFIRLPNFQDFYVGQLKLELERLYQHVEPEGQADSTQRVLRACDKYVKVAEIASKDSIKRREFVKTNADVFGWKQVSTMMQTMCQSKSLQERFEQDQEDLALCLKPDAPGALATLRVSLTSNEGFFYVLTNYLKVNGNHDSTCKTLTVRNFVLIVQPISSVCVILNNFPCSRYSF